MSQTDSIAALVATLPAGPWQAFGDSVYAGSKIILVALGPTGPTIAKGIAQLPEMVRVLIAAHPDAMAARIEELEREVETLKAQIADRGQHAGK